jgi:hypothetical protein
MGRAAGTGRSGRRHRALAPSDNFTVPGTEAQHAFDLLHERFPGTNADGASARMVFKAPDGQKITATANKAAVEQVVTDLKNGPRSRSVRWSPQGCHCSPPSWVWASASQGSPRSPPPSDCPARHRRSRR